MPNAARPRPTHPVTANAENKKEDKPVTCHDAAVDAFRKMFAQYLKAKVLRIKDEHRLSKQPLRIDILIIKKIADVPIDNIIGRIFRAHNVVEFKSPKDMPTIHDFNKVVHGYAGIYASQEKIMLSDMTVTIVCDRQPEALFETLKRNNYKILRKSNGIYYITLKGSVPEKSLLIQFVTYSELPDSEVLLKALRPDVSREQVRKILEYARAQKGYNLYDSFWGMYFIKQNHKIFTEEADMNDWKNVEKTLVKVGLTKKWEQNGVRRGKREGMRELLNFLKSGHSIEEAERKFANRELQLA